MTDLTPEERRAVLFAQLDLLARHTVAPLPPRPLWARLLAWLRRKSS